MSSKRVLIVDDVELNRDILGGILEDDYDLLFAENGQEALDIIYAEQNTLSTVLLDLMMPVLDGYGVLEKLNETDIMSKVPVIVITGEDTVESEKKCFDYGVTDFIHKPFDPSIVRLRVSNVSELYVYKNSLEEKVLEQTKKLKDQNAQLVETNQKIVDLLGVVVEYRDAESGQHINRVKSYTRALAKVIKEEYPEYGLTDEDVDLITAASVLHDVGKVAIPDSILLKNGRLTDEEYDVIKSHTVKGSEIIAYMSDTWEKSFFTVAYDIARHHHERFDGRGYPDKLVGENIPISAQIAAIADVYDALVTKRPYKEPFSKEKAFEMIVNGECGNFSEKVLDCFTKAKEEFEKVTEALK